MTDKVYQSWMAEKGARGHMSPATKTTQNSDALETNIIQAAPYNVRVNTWGRSHRVIDWIRGSGESRWGMIMLGSSSSFSSTNLTKTSRLYIEDLLKNIQENVNHQRSSTPYKMRVYLTSGLSYLLLASTFLAIINASAPVQST